MLTFGGLGLLLLALAAAAALGCLALTVFRLRGLTGENAGLRAEVARLEAAHTELELLSVTDPLTGIGNYRYLQEVLDKEVLRARRFGHPFALLLLDLDSFRSVNARHGHQVAGAVLREFAQRVAVEVRKVDTLARYGGEEFVVLLPETDAAGAAKVAERLCYAVGRERFGSPGDPVRLTLSVGAAVLSGDDPDAHGTALLRAADADLTRAKAAKRVSPREVAGNGYRAPD